MSIGAFILPIQTLTSTGRTYINATQTMTDADVNGVAGTLYDYPSGVLTANRNFSVHLLTDEGDVVQISNRCEDQYVINLVGGTVYNIYDEEVPYVLAKSLSEIRLIRTVYRIFLK